jgi:hypothetical protein
MNGSNMTPLTKTVVRSIPTVSIGIVLTCVLLIAAYLGAGGVGILAAACGLISSASLVGLVWMIDRP